MRDVVHLTVGTKLWLGGEEVTLLEKSNPQQAMVLTPTDERRVVDLWAHIGAGTLTLAPPSTPTQPARPDGSEKAWREAQRRETIVAPLLHGPRVKQRLEEAARTHGLSTRTLQRWKRAFERGGAKALLPRDEVRGGKGGRRLSPEREDLLTKTLVGFYCRRPPPTQAETYLEVRRVFREKDLDPPALHTVRARIKELRDQRATTRAREGAARARARHDTSRGAYPDLIEPLQVLFVDHTPLDVILVDSQSRCDIGRAYLTIMEDGLTRMVAGYYLSLDSPSYLSVAMCLGQAVESKEGICKRFEIPPERWPVRGLPVSLHCDNGKEFRSTQFDRLTSTYQIDVLWSPVRRPNYKGTVERLFGTINGWFHSVPGTTQSSVAARGDYEATKAARLTLDEAEQILVNKIALYHVTPHGTLGRSPLQAWKDAIGKGHGPSHVPIDMRAFQMALLPSAHRTIQRDGISFEGVTYSDGVLNAWRGNSSRQPKHIEFKWDPRNMRCIHVIPPEGGAPVKVPCRDRTVGDFSLMELRRAKAVLKAERDAFDEADVFETMRRVQAIVESATQKTTQAKRERRLAERATRQRVAAAAHAEQPAQSPRSAAKPPPRAAASELSTEFEPPTDWGSPVLNYRASPR
ncbi:MAG: DDE-type integrase/transposase/recombinase [Polyangiales bacterium]